MSSDEKDQEKRFRLMSEGQLQNEANAFNISYENAMISNKHKITRNKRLSDIQDVVFL